MLSSIENAAVAAEFSAAPWDFVVDKVKDDLFLSLEKDMMKGSELGEVKPYLVLRLGKVLFYGNHSYSMGSIKGSSLPRDTLKRFCRSSYTHMPHYFTKYITNDVLSKAIFIFEADKDVYHVKLFDNMRPESTISCKCIIEKGTNQLLLYKIELNQVRHLVEDMSCLEKNLDLRLMLCTKKNLSAVIEEKLEKMKSLIREGILDSEVKGGVRWLFGKQSFDDDQYTMVGVWHTNTKTYSSSSMKLKVRDADRFGESI